MKYNEDKIFKNGYYSAVAGITLTELNELEHSFLSLINFNLFVKEEDYSKYFNFINNSEDEEEDDTDSCTNTDEELEIEEAKDKKVHRKIKSEEQSKGEKNSKNEKKLKSKHSSSKKRKLS